MVGYLSIVAYTFPMRMLTPRSVDEILPLKYENRSTYFKGLLFDVENIPSCLKYEFCFIRVQVKVNASYCLFQIIL